jgi:hypothetical protein
MKLDHFRRLLDCYAYLRRDAKEYRGAELVDHVLGVFEGQGERRATPNGLRLLAVLLCEIHRRLEEIAEKRDSFEATRERLRGPRSAIDPHAN